MVVHHGDFLIRDSLSSQGDYVLTVHWGHKILHFLISKVLVRSGETYSRVQYTLDRETFDSLPALIHFYAGNRTVLTLQSGAQIHHPVNRTLPLRYLESLFSEGESKSCVVSSPSRQRVALVKSSRGKETSHACPLR